MRRTMNIAIAALLLLTAACEVGPDGSSPSDPMRQELDSPINVKSAKAWGDLNPDAMKIVVRGEGFIEGTLFVEGMLRFAAPSYYWYDQTTSTNAMRQTFVEGAAYGDKDWMVAADQTADSLDNPLVGDVDILLQETAKGILTVTVTGPNGTQAIKVGLKGYLADPVGWCDVVLDMVDAQLVSP